MNRLTKMKALELLPAVVDGEASEEERMAFFDYLENDLDVKAQYEDALHIKHLLSNRLPRIKAPSHLKKRIQNLLDEHQTKSYLDIPIESGILSTEKELTDRLPQPKLIKPFFRYITAAAIILFITLTTIELLDRLGTVPNQPVFLVEDYTVKHFISSDGKLIDPHFSTASTTEAENYLSEHYGIEMTVPVLKGAEFAGVVFSDFLAGFNTPLLEYVQPEIGETIYIFAFDMDKVNNQKNLKRHDEAVKNCITKTDFYVAEIEGHHVVSWYWDNNWYAAVSNHNGYDLAALVEPLNYSR